MNSPEERIERSLRALPTRGLSTEALQRIRSAMSDMSDISDMSGMSDMTDLSGISDMPETVGAPRTTIPPGLWSRPIPLWHAAAACLLLCTATIVATRLVSTAPSSSAATPISQSPPPQTDISPITDRRQLAQRTDIRRWTHIDLRSEAIR